MTKDNERQVKTTNSFEQDARYLTMIFVTLKLCGVISWSWWWVLCPVPILIAVGLLYGIVSGIAKSKR